MAKSRKSRKAQKQKKGGGKKKETAERKDTPGNTQASGYSAPNLPDLAVEDIPGLIDDFDLPSPAHLIGYTDSADINVLRVCRLKELHTSIPDPTSLVLCGFDVSQYAGDLDVWDVWVYPEEPRLTDKHMAYRFAGYDTCSRESESDAIILPMDLQQDEAEALTLHGIFFSPAMLYAFRLFKDKPIWDMVRPIRENIIGNKESGSDWRYSFPQWQSAVEKFNKLRNAFNRTVRTVRDFLTAGLPLIKQAAALMCRTQAFDWMLGEIILQDRMLGREYLAYRDDYDQADDGAEFYISDQAWLDIVKEDPAGEGDDDGADYPLYICYRDAGERLTFMFSQHTRAEEMTTIWDVQQCTDPVVYIGDLVEPDTQGPWLPKRRKAAEEPSSDCDSQSAQIAVDPDDWLAYVASVEEYVFVSVPAYLQSFAKEIDSAFIMDWDLFSYGPV
jgi:hypothetical protein